MSPSFAATAVLMAALALWCFSTLDRARWYSFHRRRRGRRRAEFEPLCFWHRRGGSWYDRRLAEYHVPPHAARAARRGYTRGQKYTHRQ